MSLRRIEGLALASLSGESDAEWAMQRENWIQLAFLGGLALDEPTRNAARSMVERGRNEFITQNPVEWIRSEFTLLEKSSITPCVNVRASEPKPLQRAGSVVSQFNGILEINAHCRQPEMIEAGCGHALLRDTERLWEYLDATQETGVTVSLKARFEVPGANTVEVLNEAAQRGCEFLHVDTMDSSEQLKRVTSGKIIANNGVRTPKDLSDMADYGAEYVSVARGDSPEVLKDLKRHIDSEQDRANKGSEIPINQP